MKWMKCSNEPEEGAVVACGSIKELVLAAEKWSCQSTREKHESKVCFIGSSLLNYYNA